MEWPHVGLGPVLLLGVLGVVDDEIGPVAQLEHGRGPPSARSSGAWWSLTKATAQSAGFDAEPERGPDMGDLPDEHLGRAHRDDVVGHLVELDLALELFHLHREERGLDHPVDDVVQGPPSWGGP